ncbi:MAG: ribokinase [Candidatus Caldatribacteriota bacterium]|nr:ribokinase [Candidatus Caldatribacteriota bacterium]
MKKVLVFGSINIDFVSFSSRYPQPGETLVSNDFGIFQGGKGANQAIALSKLGVPTLMLGKVGKDMLGDFALSSLQKNGVDTAGISKCQTTSTGSASIWVNAEGQNSILIYQGANGEVDENIIIRHEKLFTDTSCFLTQFEVPLESILLSLKFARKHGLKTFMDPAPVRKINNNNIWELVDYLFPNEIELRELTQTDDILSAIHILKSRGVKEVIVKLGKKGAGYEDGGKLILFPAVPVEQVIDTTGAGDCFVAGFLYGMMQQNDITQAIKIGNLTASYSIRRKGAAISFPDKFEINWSKL